MCVRFWGESTREDEKICATRWSLIFCSAPPLYRAHSAPKPGHIALSPHWAGSLLWFVHRLAISFYGAGRFEDFPQNRGYLTSVILFKCRRGLLKSLVGSAGFVAIFIRAICSKISRKNEEFFCWSCRLVWPQPAADFALGFMSTRLSFFAIALWLVSLFIPTLPREGSTALVGYQLVGQVLVWLLFFPLWILYPLHIIGFASNSAIFHECLFAFFQNSRPTSSFFTSRYLGFLLGIDVYLGLSSLGTGKGLSAPPLQGVLTLPGYYVWLASIACLLASRLTFMNGTKHDSPT